MTFGNLSTETLAKLSPQLMTSRGRPTKFTSERLQQIRNLVERGESREQIAEILDVTDLAACHQNATPSAPPRAAAESR